MLVVSLLATLALALPSIASASPGWSLQPTSEPAGAGDHAEFHDVSCPSSSFCMAVGTVDNGTSTTAAIWARWNGTSWSRAQLIVPTGASAAALNGVSCPSSTSCVAVGGYSSGGRQSSFAEHWTGSAWVRDAVPVASGDGASRLNGVSCPSVGHCFAVGGSQDSRAPIAEIWNGSAWSPQPVHGSSSTGLASELNGVSCFSTTSCVAVGGLGIDSYPVVATLSSSTWNWSVLPDSPGMTYTVLRRVSCPAANLCLAVGAAGNDSVDRAYIARWNGSSWGEQTASSPYGPSLRELSAIDCPGTRVCTAVGFLGGSAGEAMLAERFNGTAWVPQPTGYTGVEGAAAGVSCPTAGSCTAVGYAYDASNRQVTLAEVWGGPTWASIAPAAPPAVKQANLFSTSCPRANWCLAVGSYDDSGGRLNALGEVWDGSRWTQLPALPLPSGATDSSLLSVSCPLAARCVAVGSYTRGSDSHLLPLLASWNGHAWSLIVSPDTGAAYAQLEGVSCKSITECAAVGIKITSLGSPYSRPLAEQVSGTSATAATVPLPHGATASALHGLWCDTSLDCIAVGNWTDQQSGSGELPLSYRHLAGGGWTIMTNPSLGSGAGEQDLFGVSCTSLLDCVAVGGVDFSVETPLSQTLGSTGAWTDASPTGPRPSAFKASSCLSANWCEAVGYRSSASHTVILADHFDGSRWVVQATDSQPGDDRLFGVSCTTSVNCMAVGGLIGSPPEPVSEIYS